MRPLFKIIIAFLVLTGLAGILVNVFDIEFDNVDFWTRHGFIFLIFITFFPRLTLFFSSVPFGGLFWWLGFIFAPRLLVAILATISYYNTNKMLVILSWFFALSGEPFEKTIIYRKANSYREQPKRMRNITPGASH